MKRVPSIRRLGFTLIEAMMTTVIVGVGGTAALALLATGTKSNEQSAELTTAVNLANSIHELCDRLPFADSNNLWGMQNGQTIQTITNVTGLDGQTFAGSNGTGPIDGATRQAISSMTTWTQQVSVASVDPNHLTFNEPSKSTLNWPASRVTVTITHNGAQVFQSSWIVVR